ncbi:MAG: heme-dependent peroxidase [Pirellulaceae bacterium]|jgi:chlorite dismutase|nr:heme-dependent peroxidase [Pirellulaceae bacterium]
MVESGSPSPAAAPLSRSPRAGWHCAHFFYRWRRDILATLDAGPRQTGAAEFVETLNPQAEHAPARLQTSLVSGHRADWAVMMLDPDPLRIDGVHQRLLAGPLGPALDTAYSFISLTEVSEYVPTVEQYRERLLAEGETEDSPALAAKVKAYARREPLMRQQRLMPDLPNWPATCFYPMNKKREPGENWFTLDFDTRQRLMAEHARSGMAFAGQVSQLITVALGLDDWEWGVTLWATSPDYLKDIVYRMRFDEASARYAQFGPFFVSYLAAALAILDHCRVLR